LRIEKVAAVFGWNIQNPEGSRNVPMLIQKRVKRTDGDPGMRRVRDREVGLSLDTLDVTDRFTCDLDDAQQCSRPRLIPEVVSLTGQHAFFGWQDRFGSKQHY
jgi:hypothetical protein